jgi:hypothetical protein
MTELETSRTWMETVNLMRVGKAEIEANPDAVSISGAVIEALALTGQFSRADVGTPGTTSYKGSIDRYRPIMATAMGYSWIVTDANTRLDQLAVGRAYVRMNLEASRLGLGCHPCSQALQEFAEMQGSFAKVHSMLGASGGQRVQMLARIGYGPLASKTPRWPLESKLL